MKDIARLSFNNVLLLPIACYALGSALAGVLRPELLEGNWAQVMIFSLFLSPALAALAVWRFLKGEKSIVLLISFLSGATGVLCWSYLIWGKIH